MRTSFLYIYFLCSFLFFFFSTGAKLPLYAFEKVNKLACKKGHDHENTDPPVPFLDSLLLGEVKNANQK